MKINRNIATVIGLMSSGFACGMYYKETQIAPLVVELAEIKSSNESIKERMVFLQDQNFILKEKNKIYSDWIKNHNNTKFFDDIVDDFVQEITKNKNLIINVQNQAAKNESSIKNIIKTTVNYGYTYSNHDIKVTVGVVQINPNRTADINITSSNKNETVLMKGVTVGEVFSFSSINETQYELIIDSINYVGNYIEISIIEQK